MSAPPTGIWTASGPQPDPTQPPQSWMQRNWKRLIALLVGLFVLAVFAFAAGIVGLVMWSFRQSDVARLALEKARKNPEVAARLGEPIEAGLLFSGSMSTNGDSGSATITIPIHGPKGKADLYLDARKTMGDWTFQYVVVKLATGERIQVAGEPGRQLGEPSKPPETKSF